MYLFLRARTTELYLDDVLANAYSLIIQHWNHLQTNRWETRVKIS